jgi:hypothetical protein
VILGPRSPCTLLAIDSTNGDTMNLFDDQYRAQATATLAERYRLDGHRVDYAAPLLAFMRGERCRVDYVGPLLAFFETALALSPARNV